MDFNIFVYCYNTLWILNTTWGYVHILYIYCLASYCISQFPLELRNRIKNIFWILLKQFKFYFYIKLKTRNFKFLINSSFHTCVTQKFKRKNVRVHEPVKEYWIYYSIYFKTYRVSATPINQFFKHTHCMDKFI